MSLYNAIMGTNPLAGILLGMLGADPNNIPRFRDTWFDPETGNIVIYTRTGGGNRGYYDSLDRHIAECDYGECKHEGPFNEDIRILPGFKFDCDDDFDSTYATFHFDVPAEFVEYLEALKKIGSGEDRGGDGFRAVLEKLNKGDTGDPRVERAMEVGKQIVGQIDEAMKGDESKVIKV